jgi:predicted ATPase
VLGADRLDVARARTLLAEGRATADRDPARACAMLREALDLWRGPAFADLLEVTPLANTAVGFEQLRRELTDLLIECAIDAGQVDGVVELAADALAADPLREPAILRLMRALAMSGRAPEALRTGREYRRRLAAEAGLDPSAELGELERGIAGGTIGPVHAARPPDGPTVRPATPFARSSGRLLGRDAQLAALHRLLAAERLVTIVGPGGVGKTRVSVELAQRADTATVLLLAPVTDPAAIPHALAGALGLREVRGDVLSACIAVLGGGPRLLVVDNCEHLLAPVRDMVAAVLDGCPELTVLATSREPLGLAAECSSRIAPLPVPSPEPLDDRDTGLLERVPSVAVFLERAARVRPGFAPGPDGLRLVADIVRRLDGIPLAIELAAGRLSTFSLTDLASRLHRALDLLGSGRPTSESRHRTLRTTLDRSYDLLTSDERRLFRHLSVFVDGIDLAAAELVAADLGLTGDPGTALAHLVEASMIDATFDGRSRYRMLETLRTFGLDRLAAAGEDAPATRRVLGWAVELTGWIDGTLTTEREPEADAALRRELPNLRSAWRLARRQQLLDDAATLVISLSEACSWRDLAETWEWAEELADDPALADHPRAGAVLGCAAGAAYMRGDYLRADRLARAGLELATDAEGRRRCLSALALADLSRGAYADVLEHSLAAAALATRSSEDLGIAALSATYSEDLDQARELNNRMAAAAASPTLSAFGAYVHGEQLHGQVHAPPGEVADRRLPEDLAEALVQRGPRRGHRGRQAGDGPPALGLLMHYLAVYHKPNVELVGVRDNPIHRIVPDGIELADGTVRLNILSPIAGLTACRHARRLGGPTRCTNRRAVRNGRAR